MRLESTRISAVHRHGLNALKYGTYGEMKLSNDAHSNVFKPVGLLLKGSDTSQVAGLPSGVQPRGCEVAIAYTENLGTALSLRVQDAAQKTNETECLAQSFYVLLHPSLQKDRSYSVKVMFYVIPTLCLTTTAYWGYRLQYSMAASRFRDAAVSSVYINCTGTPETLAPIAHNVPDATAAVLNAAHDLVIATAMSLTINLLISDAIILWRAAILYPARRVLIWAGVLLTSITFGCAATAQENQENHAHYAYPMMFFMNNACGMASATLSLITNVGAVYLIRYKAWEHKRDLKCLLGEGRTKNTHVLKILRLFVYLGTMYCVFWLSYVVFLLVVKFRQIPPPPLVPAPSNPTAAPTLFWIMVDTVLGATLVPVVAVYPLLMIVLVALDHPNPGTLPTLSLNHASSFEPAYPPRCALSASATLSWTTIADADAGASNLTRCEMSMRGGGD
ncbi:uncharacterized protein BXZ73DRAFT_103208 [Epithele typhae]|uniref:uncharacterized protein n=1 Tax=Epithele typhae TaxID=378194 RepID=UPI0020083C4E|nr:uncharacterized protein BXZ73DRAFT_103208 [Epithele typhae]KAH9925679.1 hypothetical protein BXZ73DRAFT_103208 [Epithele typhae]